MNKDAVEDWLRVRRDLLAKEAAFTDLAIRVAAGDGSEEDLQKQRRVLEGMRELCTAAYERAFPRSNRAKETPGQ